MAQPNHIDVHHHFYPPEFNQAVNDFTGHKLPVVERWTPEAPRGALTRARALVAARVGPVRLIDNARLDRGDR